MKYKDKTLDIKRARDEKIKRIKYFGYYLLADEGILHKKLE